MLFLQPRYEKSGSRMLHRSCVLEVFSSCADRTNGKLGRVLIVAARPIENNELKIYAFLLLTCRQLGSGRRVYRSVRTISFQKMNWWRNCDWVV